MTNTHLSHGLEFKIGIVKYGFNNAEAPPVFSLKLLHRGVSFRFVQKKLQV